MNYNRSKAPINGEYDNSQSSDSNDNLKYANKKQFNTNKK